MVSYDFSPSTNSIRLNELKEKNVISGKKIFVYLKGGLSTLSSYHFSSGGLFPSKLPNAIKVVPTAFEGFIVGRSRNIETQRLMPCGH